MEINGKELAQHILTQVKQKTSTAHPRITPTLAIITVGEESSWQTYVRQKQKRAEELDFKTEIFNFQGKSEQEVITLVEKLNADETFQGIIIQRPLPKDFNTDAITNAINPIKDVDGFRKDSPFQPPIWLAIYSILEYAHTSIHPGISFEKWLQSQKITVLGKGETAGKPIIKGLYNLNIIPNVIDKKTTNPVGILQSADVIISGVGQTLIDSNTIKNGAILIGIGIHRENGKLRGDYDDSEIDNTASFYTPTPGGVGPLNLAYLMKNLVTAAINQSH